MLEGAIPRSARRLAMAALCLLWTPAAAQDQRFAALERFVLADDREAALESFLPGSADRSYFRCLVLLERGDFGEVDAELERWGARHGDDERIESIAARRALLAFNADPEFTWSYLDERLPDVAEIERAGRDASSVRPTALDQRELTHEEFLRRLTADPRGFDRPLGQAVLRRIDLATLEPQDLREVLQRLERPDVPGIARAVARDLEARNVKALGGLPLHDLLLTDQLSELRRLDPGWSERAAWVTSMLRRLAPDEDARDAPRSAARRAHLERLEAFTSELPARWDGLRAHVLHHALVEDRRADRLDEARFRDYLRASGTRPDDGDHGCRRTTEDADDDYATGFGRVSEREHRELCRDLLLRVLTDVESTEPYAAWFDAAYLERALAEAHLLAGDDSPRWYERIDDPAFFAELERRVELDFPASNAQAFERDEEVRIIVELKRVPELFVEVYDLDPLAHLLATGREVSVGVSLEGSLPRTLTRHEIDAPALQRVRREFTFPECAAPGAYVIEFTGGGVASRVLVRKGRLSITERIGAAGRAVRVVDERGRPVPDAAVWRDGREHRPEASGEILLPFLEDADAETLVLTDGRVATSVQVEALVETYRLDGGFWLDTEQLVAGREAILLVRPRLELAGTPVPLELLERPTLWLSFTGHDGVTSQRTLEDVGLDAAGELRVPFEVPEHPSRVTARLAGRLTRAVDGKPISLTTETASFEVDRMASGDGLVAPLLARDGAEHLLELRGRNGEPIAGFELEVSLRRGGFPDSFTTKLASDAQGRVRLGALDGIAWFAVSGDGLERLVFELGASPPRWPSALHLEPGEEGRLALDPALASRALDVSLLERRRGVWVRDASEAVRSEPGALVVEDLAPGDYDLWLAETDQSATIRVSEGAAAVELAELPARGLDASRTDPLRIRDLRVDAREDAGDALVVELAGARPDVRVHLSATRYAPAYDAARGLRVGASDDPAVRARELAASEHRVGRRLGDEERYILERRFAQAFPSVLLERPGLVLHAREASGTEAVSLGSKLGHGVGAGGGAGGKHGGRSGTDARRPMGEPGPRFADRGFLAEAPRVLADLRPDERGLVVVPLAELGPGTWIRVCAVDDDACVGAELALPWRDVALRDRRLGAPRDAVAPLGEARVVDVLAAGEERRLADDPRSRYALLGTFGQLFSLLRTLTDDRELDRFAPLTRWPELSREERLEHYDDLACHELHVFLREKDPAFFDEVVRPYLSNKRERTFLDRWLLDEPLERYLEPAAFARLGRVEQVLLLERVAPTGASTRRWLDDRLAFGELFDAARRARFEHALASLLHGELDPDSPWRGVQDPVTDGPASPGGPAGGGPSGPPAGPAGGSRRPSTGDSGFFLGQGNKERDLDSEVFEEAPQIRDLALRERSRPAYREPGATRTWVESNWWARDLADGAPRIHAWRFWDDFVGRDPSAPFVSAHAIHATGSLGEALLALAFLDLPFEAEPPASSAGGERVLRAGDPLLLLRREVLALEPAPEAASVLARRDLFAAPPVGGAKDARDTQARSAAAVDPARLEPGVAYGLRCSVSNPTSEPMRGELLFELPEGCLPLDGGRGVRATEIHVEPFGELLVHARFVFPSAGTFRLGGLHLQDERGGHVLLEPLELDVATRTEPAAPTTWTDVTERGTPDQILGHLAGRDDLYALDWSPLAPRLLDRELYDRVVAHLVDRLAFVPAVWRFAVHHRDVDGTRAYLRTDARLALLAGPRLRSPLLDVDPFEDLLMEQVDFAPLYPARVHPFGAERRIPNVEIAAAFEELLGVLALESPLDDRARLELCHAFLCQGRYADALEQLDLVDPARLTGRLQHDYLATWAAFLREDLAGARRLAEPHRDHPVPRWRGRFREALAVLDEAAGLPVVRDDEPEGRDAELAARTVGEPRLELELSGDVIRFDAAGLERALVAFHPIDLESRFSRDPFGSGEEGGVFVRPAATRTVELAGEEGAALELPSDLAGRPLWIEARAGDLVRRTLHQPTRLSVELTERTGRLVVRDRESGRPVPKVYVKVYARLVTTGSTAHFHKDGYTDVLGRFDYASVTPPQPSDVRRFAILVLGEEAGAVVREAAAP